MPLGSFWTQPSGEVHITAAKGEENIAYVEIDSGPDLKTVYIGSLAMNKLVCFQSPVVGLPMNHW